MADNTQDIVNALKGMGTPEPETYEPVVQGIAHSMATPGAVMSQNPYQPGTEEHQWYENNRADNMGQWSNRTALGMMGGGVPMAEEGAAGIFGGKLARTADIPALKEATSMHKAGLPEQQIWQDTGWFRAPTDRKWRFEIPDTGANMLSHGLDYANEGDSLTGPAHALFQHKELYKAYPELGQLKLQNSVFQNPANNFGSGQFDINGGVRGAPHVAVNAPNLLNATSIGVHEMQHGVQDIEHFARGGDARHLAGLLEQTPEKLPLHEHNSDPMDMYRRLAGEVEARNAQTRHVMGLLKDKYGTGEGGVDDFSKIHPFDQRSMDVPFDQQLIHNPKYDIVTALRGLK